jgi:hypothetical protein
MTKVEKFLELQQEVNNQIEKYGEASMHDTMILEVLGDSLSDEEIDEACRLWALENC